MILLSTVITSMEKELGAFFSTEAHPDMYRYINSAVNYIYNRRDWQWNRTIYSFSYLSANTEQTLPFFATKIFRAKFNNTLIDVLNNEEWFLEDDHSNFIGVFGDKFIATATGTYQILYAKPAPSIQSGDTYIDLPDFYIDALQAIAIHYAYKDIKDYSSASALIGQANAILDNVTERTVDTYPRKVTRLGSNHSF